MLDGSAWVRPLDEPRPRTGAEFHLRCDALTLAEILAEGPRRVGRFVGSLRVAGRRESAQQVLALADTRKPLSELLDAGAVIDPVAAMAWVTTAIDPDWTWGKRFAVELNVAGERRHLVIADGARPVLRDEAPRGGAAAAIDVDATALDRLLRGETLEDSPSATFRGDKEVVGEVLDWLRRIR